MKKSKIVSYTSDELKQMHDESDWVAADAMTDEEIEAAIASDPEEAALHNDWMKRATVVRRKPRFVMCINTEGDSLTLTTHKVYKVIPDADAEQHGMVHIIDDTGKARQYSSSRFTPVPLTIEAEQNSELEVA